MMDEFEILVQAAIEDSTMRPLLTDWLEDQGERPVTRERLVERWPGDQGGRWYWWRASMKHTPAPLSAKLPNDLFDALSGPDKRAEESWYGSVLEAFRALRAALG
jgi:hypothetical protein